MENQYASIVNTPIGELIIFADDIDVTEITFETRSIEGLRESVLTLKVADQLNAYFNGSLSGFDFPFKQKGTKFQQGVWKNLLDLPYGETVSYAKFSAHQPLAIRAIAAANGKNKLAIVVPCHRVIGSNGKLVGYAGGLWRKQWLLRHEKEIAQKGQTELKF